MLKYFRKELSIKEPLCHVYIIEIKINIRAKETHPPSVNLVRFANKKVVSIERNTNPTQSATKRLDFFFR
jgi:hypothetical protein